MNSIRQDGCTLAPLKLDKFQPILRRLGDRNALARRRMGAFVNVDRDARMAFLGVFFLRECLDVPVALLIGVIDDPAFLLFAAPRCPRLLPLYLVLLLLLLLVVLAYFASN